MKYHIKYGFLALCTFALGLSPAGAQEPVQLGLAVPKTGGYELIGQQLQEGVLASRLNGNADIVVEDTTCSEEGGVRSAERLADQDITIIIGYPCVDALDAAKRSEAMRGKTIIVPASLQVPDAPGDRDKQTASVIQFGPSQSDEFASLAGWISDNWRDTNFGIIDDGTLYGRQLADTVRAALGEQQLTPVYNDTFRPRLTNQFALVRRLQRAGVNHLVIGGEAYDAAVIASHAAEIGYSLTIAGGSALEAPAEDGLLPDGTILVALPRLADLPDGGQFARSMEAAGLAPEGYHVWGYASGQIAADIQLNGPITGRSVDTVFGPVSFDGDGNLATNLFVVLRIENGVPKSPSGGETNG